MTWYILPNSITKLFVSMSMLTTLSFDSEIVSYLYGGSKEEMFFEVTNNQKTLAMKALAKNINTNLMIITKKQKYYFDIIESAKESPRFIEVRNGKINKSYKQVKVTKNYTVDEGKTSLRILYKKSGVIEYKSLIR